MAFFRNEDICVAAVAAAVPKNRVTVDSFIPVFGKEATDKFTNGTGIGAMFKALPEQTASDLAYAAATNLFEKFETDKNEIGTMVFVTQSPDYRRPSSACVLQGRLGLPEDTATLEINLGCSGFVYGMTALFGLMNATDKKYGLLLIGETASKLVNPQDKSIVMMYGDAGAAVLFEKKQGCAISTLLRSDGSRYRSIILPGGGFRDMYPPRDTFVCADGIERSLYDIYMDGTAVFSFSITDIPKALKDYLEKTGTTSVDYDMFFIHQANRFIISQISRKLKLPADKVPISLDRYGNTGGISIPLTICDSLGNETGKTFNSLVCGFGIGLSWGVSNLVIDSDKVLPVIETADYFKKGKITPEMLK